MSFDTDFSAFDRTFEQQSNNLLSAAERGVGQAMMQLLNDCNMVEPQTPHAEGTLRGSGSAFVGKKLVGTTLKSEAAGTPSLENNVPDSDKKQTIFGVAGFNTPYAARLHEHPEFDFKEEGTGGKYMESKINMFKEQYVKLVAINVDKAKKAI